MLRSRAVEITSCVYTKTIISFQSRWVAAERLPQFNANKIVKLFQSLIILSLGLTCVCAGFIWSRHWPGWCVQRVFGRGGEERIRSLARFVQSESLRFTIHILRFMYNSTTFEKLLRKLKRASTNHNLKCCRKLTQAFEDIFAGRWLWTKLA